MPPRSSPGRSSASSKSLGTEAPPAASGHWDRFRLNRVPAAHVGQVDHGCGVAAEPWQFRLAIDHASQPNRGSGAALRFIRAEGQELRHQRAEPRENGPPLRIAVGPEDGYRFLDVVGFWADSASRDAFSRSTTVRPESISIPTVPVTHRPRVL